MLLSSHRNPSWDQVPGENNSLLNYSWWLNCADRSTDPNNKIIADPNSGLQRVNYKGYNSFGVVHCNNIDVIMTTMASQITSLTVVYSTVYSDADKKKPIKAPRHWPLCGEFTGTGEFPAQRGSYAQNVSIWRRHHVTNKCHRISFRSHSAMNDFNVIDNSVCKSQLQNIRTFETSCAWLDSQHEKSLSWFNQCSSYQQFLTDSCDIAIYRSHDYWSASVIGHSRSSTGRYGYHWNPQSVKMIK